MAGYSTPLWNNGNPPAIDAAALTAMGNAIELAQHPYGVCTTAAATAEKTVSIDYSGTLELFDGLEIRVMFQNGNTAANPTLNVNGTGAKSIVFSIPSLPLKGNEVLTLVYANGKWVSTAQNHLRVVSGTYTGTGAQGSAEKPVELVIPGAKKLHCIFISDISNSSPRNYIYYTTMFAVPRYGAKYLVMQTSKNYGTVSAVRITAAFDPSSSTLRRYSSNDDYSLNESGVMYNYTALVE